MVVFDFIRHFSLDSILEEKLANWIRFNSRAWK